MGKVPTDQEMETRKQFIRDLYNGILKRPVESDEALRFYLGSMSDEPSFTDAAALARAFASSEEAEGMRTWRVDHLRFPQSYKNFISIGSHCITSYTLKKLGLKKFSGPFDWVFSNTRMVKHCIEDDFDKFLDRRYVEPKFEEGSSTQAVEYCDHTYYRGTFGVQRLFNHYDMRTDQAFSYYERCVSRFRAALNSGEATLLVAIVPDYALANEDFFGLCDTIDQFRRCSLLIVRAIGPNVSKFGANLATQRGRHRVFDLNMTGTLGPVAFSHTGDEVTFQRILDICSSHPA